MKIITVRHTTVDVPPGTCYGHSDVPVAGTFDSEKKAIAMALENENFKVIYSSPLLRCRKLTEYLAKGRNIIYEERLKELHFGNWEGMSWDEISKTKEAKQWFGDWLTNACPDGESYLQLISRVDSFLQQIIEKNEDVLIITHGGVCRALYCLINKLKPEDAFKIEINYGCIVKFEKL